MTAAGDLKHKVGFFRRAVAADEYGNTEGGYPDAPEFQCAAGIRVKFGGETVLAARLQGQNTATITVRQSAATAAVTTDWRAKDMRRGTIWNIRSIADPEDSGEFWEMLCESGVAS
jgi:head-tail adaptor